MGDDTDSPNLARILASVQARWNIDPTRLLLTGMSDGGTFCYVSGLESASPFTHLAPVAATFHPLMAEMADAERLRGLPVYLVHGKLDWMFPVQVARQTARPAVGGRRRRHLPRTRRPQPHLSARDQRGDLEAGCARRSGPESIGTQAGGQGPVAGRWATGNHPTPAHVVRVVIGGFAMRVFLGMILGALLLTAGIYVYDLSSTSTVANGQAASANRTIVNWDVAATEWNGLKKRAQDDWVKLSSK